MKTRWLAVLLSLGFMVSLTYPLSAESPLSNIEVNIPEYELEQIEGYDYVDIPGGDILLVDGRPRVPYYPVFISYSEGYRVQDVLMTEKSGLETATGLNLPTVVMEPALSSDGEPSPINQQGWYPEKDFDWNLQINSDGSSTLLIAVCPFHYDAETTDVRFYRHYSFDIGYVPSTVAITGVTADKSLYEPGDTVALDIWLKNAGDTRDVIISIAMKHYGTDELIAGLPMRLLKDFVGEGSYSAEWSTLEARSGDYYAEVTLTDTSGNILDRDTMGFGIQVSETVDIPPDIPEEPAGPGQESTGFPTLYVAIGAALAVAVTVILLAIKSRKKA